MGNTKFCYKSNCLFPSIFHSDSCSCFFYCVYQRLFICETSKEGQSCLVELDEHQATMKHVYHGLWKQSVGVVPFDTMKNQFLATGDAFKIKFSDMDNG